MGRWLLAALALLFLGTVIARFPANWGLALAPRDVRCVAASGSIWQGSCRGLQAAGLHFESAHWQLHPLALLRARLAISLELVGTSLDGHGDLELAGGGRVDARDLQATLPLDAALLPGVPRGWAGQLQLALTSAQFVHGKPAGLLGTIAVRELRQLDPPLPFGNYTLRFATPPDASGQQRGELRDAGGPLAIAGTLQLGSDGQYELEGTVAARADAPQDLAGSLALLGPADASGRRPFSLAGTL